MITSGRGGDRTWHSSYGSRVMPAFADAAARRRPHPGADIALHQRFCGNIFELSSVLNTQRHVCRAAAWRVCASTPVTQGSMAHS
jgi:hypothetical protein